MKATEDRTPPVALIVYPDDWVDRLEYEWEPVSAAAVAAGFRVVIAEWRGLEVRGGVVTARDCRTRQPGHTIERSALAECSPVLLLTTWGSDSSYWDLYLQLVAVPGCYHSESPVLSELDSKCELESCLRAFETATGRRVSRPPTRLSDEINATDASPADEHVIVKPTDGGKGKGIEIVPRSALPQMAAEAASGVRRPFVMQELIQRLFLYEGRRWDIRFYVGATSLDPLRYRIHPQGVVKPSGIAYADNPGHLAAWLTNASYRASQDLPLDNLSLTEMLSYLEAHGHRLDDFWKRIDELGRDVMSAVALYGAGRSDSSDHAFYFAGLDLMVEAFEDGRYEIRLLELNSHPGYMEWGASVNAQLAPLYREWFGDLLALVQGDEHYRGASAQERG